MSSSSDAKLHVTPPTTDNKSEPAVVEKRTGQVVVLWDYDNVPFPSSVETSKVIKKVTTKALEYGNKVRICIFTNLSNISDERLDEFTENGCEVNPVGSRSARRPESVDKRIIVKMAPEIYSDKDTIILISGDNDYLPFINNLIHNSISTVLIYPPSQCNSKLLNASWKNTIDFNMLIDLRQEELPKKPQIKKEDACKHFNMKNKCEPPNGQPCSFLHQCSLCGSSDHSLVNCKNKTKELICTHFMKGKCKDGDKCNLSHSLSLQTLGYRREKAPRCLETFFCSDGLACKKYHTRPEKRCFNNNNGKGLEKKKIELCAFLPNCVRRATCNYAHEISEFVCSYCARRGDHLKAQCPEMAEDQRRKVPPTQTPLAGYISAAEVKSKPAEPKTPLKEDVATHASKQTNSGPNLSGTVEPPASEHVNSEHKLTDLLQTKSKDALFNSFEEQYLTGSISLKGYSIGDKEIAGLIDRLEQDFTLTHLDLSHTSLNDDTLIALSFCLTHLKLRDLNLSNNKLTDITARLLSPFIRHNSLSATSLDLSHNQFSDQGAKLFLDALKQNNHLIKFNFDGNLNCSSRVLLEIKQTLADKNQSRFGKRNFSVILEEIHRGNYLSEVNLTGLKLNDRDIINLVKILYRSQPITRVLILDYNEFSNVGFSYLIEKLIKESMPKSLVKIYLRKNNLEYDAALLSALSCNTTLQLLELSGNKLSNDQYIAIKLELKASKQRRAPQPVSPSVDLKASVTKLNVEAQEFTPNTLATPQAPQPATFFTQQPSPVSATPPRAPASTQLPTPPIFFNQQPPVGRKPPHYQRNNFPTLMIPTAQGLQAPTAIPIQATQQQIFFTQQQFSVDAAHTHHQRNNFPALMIPTAQGFQTPTLPTQVSEQAVNLTQQPLPAGATPPRYQGYN